MGDKESESFQTFIGFLKAAFQVSRVTSDAGLILVRALDDRLGLEAIIAGHLSDSRHGLNRQFRLTDLLRQSIAPRIRAALRRAAARYVVRLHAGTSTQAREEISSQENQWPPW